MGLRIHKDSHLDHGLTVEHQEWLTKRFEERDGFFIETVDLPDGLGPLLRGLHGPLCGDDPVPETEVFYATRGSRAGESRMCRRAPRETRRMTVIAGPHDGHSCILFTAFGGEVAPREPWEPGLNDSAKAESVSFWAVHALSAE